MYSIYLNLGEVNLKFYNYDSDRNEAENITVCLQIFYEGSPFTGHETEIQVRANDEGLTPENSALEKLLMLLSTHLIKPLYLLEPPTDAAPQFLWKLSPFIH